MKVAVQKSIGFQGAPIPVRGAKDLVGFIYAPDMKAIKKISRLQELILENSNICLQEGKG
jgi:hypothetical protein